MNNRRSPLTFLYNTLTTGDFGVYTDSVSGLKVLVLKEHGLQIPYSSALVTKTKVCGSDGFEKAMIVTLDPACPCDECSYEYGFAITKKVKEPGVHNDDFHEESRFYGGKLANITCTGGYIDDAYLWEMTKELVQQITYDTGLNNDPGAIVDAYLLYEITPVTGDSITITRSDGHTVVCALNTTAETAVATINASHAGATDEICVAFAASATSIYLRSYNPGGLFTVEVTTGVTATVNSREIMLVSKSTDSEFSVKIDSAFGSAEGVFYSEFVTTNNAANPTAMSVVLNGTTSALTANGLAAYITAWNAAIGTYVYAALTETATSTHFSAFGRVSDGVTSFDYVASTMVATLSNTFFYTAKGKYSTFTADDVHRIFANRDHMGIMANAVRRNTPNNVAFCKYVITAKANTDAIHGANHMDTFLGEFIIYVASSVVDDDIWDTDGTPGTDVTGLMDESTKTGFVADTTFDELLAAWMA